MTGPPAVGLLCYTPTVSDVTVGVPIQPIDTVRKHKTILGHPAGLFILFFTEMWERFSYYGMRALLVLYMVNFLLPNALNGSIHVIGLAGLRSGIESVFGPLGIQPLSSQLYGMYTAFVYLT